MIARHLAMAIVLTTTAALAAATDLQKLRGQVGRYAVPTPVETLPGELDCGTGVVPLAR